MFVCVFDERAQNDKSLATTIKIITKKKYSLSLNKIFTLHVLTYDEMLVAGMRVALKSYCCCHQEIASKSSSSSGLQL